MERTKAIHKILGYDDDLTTANITKEIVDIGNILRGLFKEDFNFDNMEEKNSSVKGQAVKFFSNKLELHQVLIEDEEMANDIMKRYDNKEYDNIFDLLLDINEASWEDSPLNIPIKYVDREEVFGGIFWRLWFIPNDELAEVIAPINNSLELSKVKTKLTSSFYIHELIHSQLHSTKHSVTKYYHSELLPIFMELLATLEKDPTEYLLRVHILKRYRQILYNIIDLNKSKKTNDKVWEISCSTYLVSTLKALNLFEIYINSSEVDKKKYLNIFSQF